MTAIDVREARASDAARLTELIIELGHPITEPDVRRNLETLSVGGLLPLVAEHDGAVIGMCGLSAMTTVHRDAPVGRISVMVVAEAWRGRGVGAAGGGSGEKACRAWLPDRRGHQQSAPRTGARLL